MKRAEIADELFSLANALSGKETGHLACQIHNVVSELWAMEALNPELEPLTDYGDLMTIAEFKHDVEALCLIDYDGFGYLATETKQSCHRIIPSDIGRVTLPEWATHVMWYNK